MRQAKDLTKNPDVADLIDEAIANSFREYVKPKSAKEAQKMTFELAQKIMADYQGDKSQSCFELGKKHNVNPGRVSELISGKHWIYQSIDERNPNE